MLSASIITFPLKHSLAAKYRRHARKQSHDPNWGSRRSLSRSAPDVCSYPIRQILTSLYLQPRELSTNENELYSCSCARRDRPTPVHMSRQPRPESAIASSISRATHVNLALTATKVDIISANRRNLQHALETCPMDSRTSSHPRQCVPISKTREELSFNGHGCGFLHRVDSLLRRTRYSGIVADFWQRQLY